MTGGLQKLLKLSLLLGLIGGLAGCGEGLGDLRQFVQQIRAKPPGRIEPIPEFTPYQNFEYASHDLRDPFKLVDFRRPDEIPEEVAQLGSGLRPDLDRVKEPLEDEEKRVLSAHGAEEVEAHRHAGEHVVKEALGL